MNMLRYDPRAEWLETDGMGGFASGSVGGARTRAYHSLLTIAERPPTRRYLFVNGIEVWIETGGERIAISSQDYRGGVTYPDGGDRLESFRPEPWPQWTYAIAPGFAVTFEYALARPGGPAVLYWRAVGDVPAGARLIVRPLLSGRIIHHLHYKNPDFSFASRTDKTAVFWRPYKGLALIRAIHNGHYEQDPEWFEAFWYREEDERGLPCQEDLGSPGCFTFHLADSDAAITLTAGEATPPIPETPEDALREARAILEGEELRRRKYTSALEKAADAYLVERGDGLSIIAGYPWFSDWSRDTFIAVRGLCITTGHLDRALAVFHTWRHALDHGMLPNLFPDDGGPATFNSVDGSLWFIVSLYELTRACRANEEARYEDALAPLWETAEIIATTYADGARYGIHCDTDGLIAAGGAGSQLTWMDARVEGRSITPRIGKPVEVQALWINALWALAERAPRWSELFETARGSFESTFWYEAGQYLYDVVEMDHVAGRHDPSLRPNQLLAIGGLPLQLVHGRRAERIVAKIEELLATPLGPRTLAPGEPAYEGRCAGPASERDRAYHQGTVWPWLIGPFIEAWVRVRGNTVDAHREAREKFLAPLFRHLDSAGLGHVSENADGDFPHTPRGCPFQAWSLGEFLRMQRLLEEPAAAPHPTPCEAS